MQLRKAVLSIALCCVAICGGFINAFDLYSGPLAGAMAMSPTFTSLCASASVSGTFFLLPAGTLYDKYGPVKLALGSSSLASVAFIGLSYVPDSADAGTRAIIIMLLLCVSFGSGAAFCAAFSTALCIATADAANDDHKASKYLPAVVSGSMGLSVMFCSSVIAAVEGAAGDQCDEDSDDYSGDSVCWRVVVRTLGFMLLGIQVPGALGMLLTFRRRDYAQLQSSDTLPPAERPLIPDPTDKPQLLRRTTDRTMSLRDVSTHVAHEPAFYVLCWAYMAAIGAPIWFLTSATGVLDDFLHGADSTWHKWILPAWSISNATGNIVVGGILAALKARFGVRNQVVLAVTSIVLAADFAVLALLRAHAAPFSPFIILLLLGTGLCFGIFVLLFPTVVNEVYGDRNFGKFYGFVQIAATVGGTVFPVLGSRFFSSTSGYLYMYIFCSVTLAIGGAGMWWRVKR